LERRTDNDDIGSNSLESPGYFVPYIELGVAMNRVTRALRIAKLAHSLGNYDTNVMGMVGEVIAEEIFGMTKTSRQTKDVDGHIMIDGAARSVQVKTLSCERLATYGGGAKFRVAEGSHPERLLVLVVFSQVGKYEVAYNGPTGAVGKVEVVSGVPRRGVCVHHLFAGRPHELTSLLHACRGDA
jgi:uncharacterized protein DUF6998